MSECQICARGIRAAKGLIAHHGFKRRAGWQSASCPGSRQRPYGESCDACKHAVKSVTAQRDEVMKLLASEPESLYLKVDRRASTGVETWQTVTRAVLPEVIAAHPKWAQYNAMTWPELVAARNRGLQNTVESMQAFIGAQQRRVKEWTKA